MIRNICALAMVACILACGNEGATEPVSPNSEEQVNLFDTNLEPEADAYLAGSLYDMPGIDNFASNISTRNNNGYGYAATAYFPYGDDGHEAMSIIYLEDGSVYHSDLEPGSSHTFVNSQSETTDLSFSIIGCLRDPDPTVGIYYDNPADQVDVWTEMTSDGQLRINYDASWDDSDDFYTGHFDID